MLQMKVLPIYGLIIIFALLGYYLTIDTPAWGY